MEFILYQLNTLHYSKQNLFCIRLCLVLVNMAFLCLKYMRGRSIGFGVENDRLWILSLVNLQHIRLSVPNSPLSLNPFNPAIMLKAWNLLRSLWSAPESWAEVVGLVRRSSRVPNQVPGHVTNTTRRALGSLPDRHLFHHERQLFFVRGDLHIMCAASLVVVWSLG